MERLLFLYYLLSYFNAELICLSNVSFFTDQSVVGGGFFNSTNQFGNANTPNQPQKTVCLHSNCFFVQNDPKFIGFIP